MSASSSAGVASLTCVPPLSLIPHSSALSYLGDALSMRMSILSDDHVDTIATLHNMARVASFQGK